MPTRTRKKIEVLECCAVCDFHDEFDGECYNLHSSRCGETVGQACTCEEFCANDGIKEALRLMSTPIVTGERLNTSGTCEVVSATMTTR